MRLPAIDQIQKALSRNLPTILSAVAVAGVVGTVVLAVKATPDAVKKINSAKNDVYEEGVALMVSEEIRELNHETWNIVKSAKVCWRCYIPAGSVGIATIACIIGANAIGMRRNAALLAAYTLADTSFRDYKDKVIEHITAQKAQKIDDEIMAEKIAKNPPKTETIIFGGGDLLCYESLTGRYFKSDAEKIRRAAQDLDARILQGDMYAAQNEFFDALGLGPCTIGAELGWNIECRLKVVFSSHITEREEACLAVGYEKLPVYNFDKL